MKVKNYVFVLMVIVYASCTNKAVQTPATVYFPQVRSIIQANCVVCHQPGGQGMPVFLTSDSLIVEHAEAIKRAVIDPVSPFNRRMPLGGHLSDADTTIIGRWYAAGGKATD
jgi:mono/diheme cytochrome c family protein